MELHYTSDQQYIVASALDLSSPILKK